MLSEFNFSNRGLTDVLQKPNVDFDKAAATVLINWYNRPEVAAVQGT
jgi:hypothetical protein